jgi:hypothetical protein
MCSNSVNEFFAMSNGAAVGSEGCSYGNRIIGFVAPGSCSKVVVSGEESHVDVAVGVAPWTQLHLCARCTDTSQCAKAGARKGSVAPALWRRAS